MVLHYNVNKYISVWRLRERQRKNYTEIIGFALQSEGKLHVVDKGHSCIRDRGNKGIGFAVVKQLAQHGLTVVLTARDEKLGTAAVENLKSEGIESVYFHPLDVTSSESVEKLVAWLKPKFGGIDILVNNAGANMFELTYEGTVLVMETNYYGVKKVIKGILPILRASPAGARIVNVSSQAGRIQYLQSEELKEKLTNANTLTKTEVDALAAKYLEDCKAGLHNQEGWQWAASLHAYRESKIFLNAYSRILARELEEQQRPHHRIFVNCVCPGAVYTDMSKAGAEWALKNQGFDVTKAATPEVGADTAIWLALLPKEDYPNGKFFIERKQVSWSIADPERERERKRYAIHMRLSLIDGVI